MKAHRILSLSIIGGFLDGLHLPFDTGLNCIIGARGTGKTTILELIRYALDQLPRKDLSPAARRRVESLVENNLQGGRVELHVETRDGIRYIITRSAGEEPIVLDARRHPTALSARSIEFFHAEIFSQNEVESIADQKRFQLDLLDSFEPARVAAYDRQIEEVRHEIIGLAKQVEPLAAKLHSHQEDAKQLPMVEERLKAIIGTRSDGTAEAVNAAHERKALRDREVRAYTAARESLGALEHELAAFVGRLKAELNGKFSNEMLEGPNKQIIAKTIKTLKTCVQGVDDGVNAARAEAQKALKDVALAEGELRGTHDQQELEFRQLIEKHKAHQAQSVERTGLERRRNELKEFERQAELLRTQLGKLDEKRRSLLDRLSGFRDQRFVLRKGVAEHLTKALSPTIRVTVRQDGNAENYQLLLEESLRGLGIQHGIVAQKLASLLPPTTLAEMVRAGDVHGIMREGELNANQAAKVVATFNDPVKLAELETVELHDAPTIELKDGAGYKDSTTLSTGQKCTTILPILLLENANPLLIDQPEDNLDNRFVFETIVGSVRQVKLSRQLIFVTHNPNIPVLGDASRVMVMESDGEHGRNVTAGTVDECQEQIITLLEGGAEAFRQRGTRYKLAA